MIAVDDAPENLALLKAAITAAGYMFLGLESGKECLALLSRMRPRLVLLDIQMPEIRARRQIGHDRKRPPR